MADFSSLNGYDVKDKIARENIEVINGTIDNLSVYVTPQMFDAKGDGITDDTQAIKQAIAQTEEKIIYFPPGTYLVTEELVFDERVQLYGSDRDTTIILYTPSKDGNFITATSTDGNMLTIKGITIQCNTTNYSCNGIVIAKGGIDNVQWGGRCLFEDAYIRSFSKSQVLIYAPFMCYFNNVRLVGTTFTQNPQNSNLCVGDSIGLSLIGYENGVVDTFGDVNVFNRCNFEQFKYGIYVTSCVSTSIENCVFEPNFINIYAPNIKGANGDRTKLFVKNSWFEDSTHQSHPQFAMCCLYEINEETGQLKEPITSPSILKTFDCVVHSGSVSSDSRMAPFSTTILGTSGATVSQLEESDVYMIRYAGAEGNYINLTANESYFLGQVASRKGYKDYTCTNINSNLARSTKMYSYIVQNPNSDKNTAFTYDLPFLPGYSDPTEYIIDVYLRCTGGFTVWKRITCAGRIILENKMMNDEASHGRTITGDIKGVNIVFDNEKKKYVLTLNATNCTDARIDTRETKLLN